MLGLLELRKILTNQYFRPLLTKELALSGKLLPKNYFLGFYFELSGDPLPLPLCSKINTTWCLKSQFKNI
jgi:hypothetical protein